MVTGFIWVLDDYGFKDAARVDWLAWTAFGVTLYAGLTMVTNAPFYSFKDISFKRSVPFIVIVAIALAIAVVNIAPPLVLFATFCVYGFSGYAVYAVQTLQGQAGERDRNVDGRARRRGLASLDARRARVRPMTFRIAIALALLLGDQRAR